MSDSDETICDEGEDHSQMSPSVLTPLVRTNYLDQNAVSCGSPEFLPPSAKVQRLANENEDQTRAESKRQYLNQEVQGSQMETTFNQEESVATERLKLLNAKKDKIEELLVTIEEGVKRGTSLRDSPVLAKVKLLMAELKTQLADFTHFQQKQRQEIAESSHMSKDGKESQWTQEKKQKILDLATQQKELLKLLHCNKNLVEKVQKLKQMSKSGTKVILPMLEAHCKSQEMNNVPQEKADKHIHQAPATKTGLSNLNIHAKTITAKSKITNASKQTLDQSVSRLGHAEPSCLTQVSSSTTTLIHGQMNSPTVIPSVSQASPLFAKAQPCLIASSNQTSTTAMCSKSMKTGSQTAVNMSARPQQKVQNAILKGGQLYQVGDKQIYVLPIGLTTDAASSQTTTQENEMPKGMSLIAPQPKTATLAVKEPLSKQGHVLPITSMVKSTQSLTLNTVSNLGSHLQTRISPQHSTCMTRDQNTKVTSANCITTALPTNSTQFPSTSSTFYQNTGVSTTTQFGSKGSEKTSETANAFATNEDSTVPMMQKSAKVQIQARKHLKITPHRSLQSTVSSCSQVSAAQVKNTSQTLQRKNSFGSDIPDIKSLLNHNVIQPGSHVLSVQFEGRNFEASLRASGLIESAGGETFRTPMAWMRAVTGSWNTVKQSQAYKMVHYKGTPLDLLTLPYVEKEPADSRDILNKNAENLAVALDGQGKIKDPIGLITCWDDVAQLLVNCRIMPIGINELVPLESVLPSNFWDSGKEADIPPSLLQELDF